MYKPCGEYNPNPQAPHPKKRKEETLIIIIFFSPLINFISNKKIKSMVKGEHDFFTNQFLPFALAVELQPINLKYILCHVIPLIACRTFTKPATIILVQ